MTDGKLDKSDKVIVSLLIICVMYFGIQILRFFFDLVALLLKVGAFAAFVLFCCALYAALREKHGR